MNSILSIYKPVGKTPLEAIEALRERNPEYKQIVLGYAGRLDPMADGVLLVLVGDENKKRKEYERYAKKYSFRVLFGVETDTYDIMGLVTSIHQSNNRAIDPSHLSNVATSYIGTWIQPYPPYSSPRVNGKPLFYWARKNALDTITIPTKKITVDSLKLTQITDILPEKLFSFIEGRITLVTGDFRQQEILQQWTHQLATMTHPFTCASFEIECSSGLYIRSLAHDIGKKMNTGAIALSITRTAVGPYELDTSLRIMDTSEKTE